MTGNALTPDDGAALLDLHDTMLQRLSAGSSLEVVLSGIAEGLEALLTEDRCTILLLEKRTGLLRTGAAPSLSTSRWQACLDNLEPGPLNGSCGRAAFYRKQVIVPDVADTPLFTGGFRKAIIAEGIRSCWCMPVIVGDGTVAGTFSLSSDFAKGPTGRQSQIVERCRSLTAIAIEHARLDGELADSEARFRRAEAASRAKSWFLSGMAHEIYTPLSGILGFTELLDSLDLSPERRRDAYQRISEGAQHVISLVDDVLDVAKIEGGALELEKEDVNLQPLLREVTGLLEPIASRRGVEIVCRPSHGKVIVVADRRRLRQVLLNVIGNAIKYNRQDGLVVTDSRREGAVVVLEIADEGPGLPDHAMDRVFQPFDRLGAERTQVQGAGLGLPLSKSLIEAMNGELLLSRAPASGAVVQIRLPAA